MADTEQRLNQRIERLTRSNDDLYQFAYLAAHELQAPLRAMEGFLSLVQNKYSSQLPEDANGWLTEACSAADRMCILIRALLTLSRVDSQDVEFEPVDTRLALDDALRNLKPVIEEKKAQIKIDPLPTIPANRALLMLLFQNLIANALKFSSEQPLIEIRASENDDHWLFSVTDNGVGFDMKYVDRLFKRFERLHAQTDYAGTGLGLALCKRIVDRHRGNIWAKSIPGQGSIFQFTIPLTKVELEATHKSN
jgi:light-regulated signal transduction histidine kinase (bacteriophytochrome)